MSRTETEPLLIAEKISKKYPGTLALDKVNFVVYPGEVGVLIGENGAGKSTLMKILAGVETPTGGRISIAGEELHLSSARDAWKYGIGIIYQELNLFPNLSVAENVFMARELTSPIGSVRHGEQETAARKLLARLEQDIEADTLVEDLRIGQQQLVEIARALAEDVRVLIMDEPTSALSTRETAALFRIIRELTAQGVAIIYVSHKLDECLEIGDRFTVLRDGRLVATGERKEASLSWIIRNMAGRAEDQLYFESGRSAGKPLLTVDNLCLPRPQGDGYLVNHISFEVHAGEVLGVYGQMGAGKTELLESLYGLYPNTTGSIRLCEQDLEDKRIDQRLAAGMALVPEDRQRQGLVQKMNVTENVTLASLSKYVRATGLSRRDELETVAEYRENLGIRMSDPGQPITTLSGGNQQKVIVAKALLTSPRVLMMDEPTRGIDVGAKADIMTKIDQFAEEGLGILIASSEAKEIVSACDRVLVLSRGRTVAELTRSEVTEQALVEASVNTPAAATANQE
jgi:erythritol transport system ATP-binding protein